MSLPASFARTIRDVHGEAGTAWLAELPGLLAACRRRWELAPDSGRFELSYGYVEAVRRADGTRAVLKLAPPEAGAVAREAAALACFAGDGAARLLDFDASRAALLLERLEPGEQLAARTADDDDAATLALAALMPRLWRAPPPEHPFPGLAVFDGALDGPHARLPAIPRAVLERARAEHAELCASAAAPVLLHGDLHHFNVLRAGAGWKAIDPKGVIGEPAYETGPLLRNPVGWVLDRATLARRADLLADALALDAERIRAWGRTQAVLSAVWSLEDGGDPAFALRCAELLG